MREFVSGFLRHPVSLTVRDPDGKLVGIRLDEIEERSVHDPDTPLKEEEKELIVSLLGALEKGINLFEK